MSTDRRNANFIELIKEEHRKGFGFIPLVGAGLSAPSGVPLIHEISDYLQFCIALTLGLDRSEEVVQYFWNANDRSYRFRKWSPRTDAWPGFVESAEHSQDWPGTLLQTIDRSVRDNPEVSWEISLFKEAYGAMADWRTALQFLSRIDHVGDSETQTPFRPILLSPDSVVIDSFFREIVQDKRPTLAHQMIALLSRTIRVKTILTTNFDELIEVAFRQIGDPLSVFEVHKHSGIPAYQLTAGSRAIVKLHGGRYGLRADFSLDESPSQADAANFLSFLIAKSINDRESRETTRYAPVNHLLVLGFSGKDRRIKELLVECCKRVSLRSFRIFWVAFNKNDERTAQKLKRELRERTVTNGGAGAPKLHILRHSSPGLLLLELYQHISLGLPPEGIIFPTTSKLPVPVEPEFTSEKEPKGLALKYSRRLLRLLQETAVSSAGTAAGESRKRLFVVTSAENVEGVVSVASHCYGALREAGSRVVWLELDEIDSAVDLFEHIVEAISIQLGADDWQPIRQSDNSDLRLREIERLVGKRQLILFLNARDGAGTYTPLHSPPNGWIDDDGIQSSSCQQFVDLLEQLTTLPSNQIKVVALLNRGNALQSIRTRLACTDMELPSGVSSFQSNQLTAKALKWLRSEGRSVDPAKTRFLAALCFANRIRYVSSLWTWAHHGGDIDAGMGNKASKHYERLDQTESWLRDLQGMGVLRVKPGGFVWMHVPSRDALRAEFQDGGLLEYRQSGEIHHGLAEWNRRLFLSCRDPLAAFEYVYHRIESAKFFARSGKEDPETVPNVVTNVCANISEALTMINTARHSILTKGFSSGNRRRLDILSDRAEELDRETKSLTRKTRYKAQIKSLLDQLQLRLHALKRDAAREVAELRIAFEYHRELHIDYVPSSAKPSGSKRLADVFDRWGNAGTMFIAARYYHKSQLCFNKLFRYFEFPEPHKSSDRIIEGKHDGEVVANYLAEVDKWIDSVEDMLRRRKLVTDNAELEASALTAKRGIVNLLRRQMQLYVVRGNLYHLISRRKFKKSGGLAKVSMDSGQRLVEEYGRKGRAEYAIPAMCYRAASSVLKTINNVAEDREEMRRSFDDLQFLETYFGLVLSFLRDFNHAHRRLNDAESCLVDSNAGKESMEQAIVELHRAEVYTQQAVFKQLKTNEEMTDLGNFRFHVLRLEEKGWSQNLQRMNERMGAAKRAGLQSSLSYIDDGIQTLVRAGRLLNQERKNVWWTTWFFELKLKLYELKLYARLFDLDMDLPVVGLSSVARGLRSELDRLLIDSMRLSRLDIYRQARILDSYSSSMLCVFGRWALDKQQRGLYFERIELMRNCCVYAQSELDRRVREKRETVAGVPTGRSKRPVRELDQGVEDYANNVISLAQRRLAMTAAINSV